jgi:hypothetical protein
MQEKLVYMKLNLATEIAPILTIFFQISLESDVAPSDWKTAHVAPVYKKGPKYNPENYRPISLTCSLHLAIDSLCKGQYQLF